MGDPIRIPISFGTLHFASPTFIHVYLVFSIAQTSFCIPQATAGRIVSPCGNATHLPVRGSSDTKLRYAANLACGV